MSEAHEIFAEQRPRKGDPVTYRGELAGYVSRVDGNLCWLTDTSPSWGSEDAPFIWCFRGTQGSYEPSHLNSLHDWPTKGEQT